jgi:hypothetical protein
LVAIETRISESIEAGSELTLTAVGGEAELLDSSAELVQSRFLPELVQMLERDWTSVSDHRRALAFLEESFTLQRHALTLANALDALLVSPSLLRSGASEIGGVLLRRTDREARRREPTTARYALDAVVRLALGGWINRFPVLTVLSDLDAAEDPDLASAACRYLSICYEQYRAPELRDALERLHAIPDSEADAAYELAMTSVLDALEQDTFDDVRVGLVEARQVLASVVSLEEERQDAEIVATALDVLLGFGDGIAAEKLTEKAQELRRLVLLRRAWLAGTHTGWIAPRADAEVEWYRLATLLADAAALVERPSWLDAREALAQVIEAYAASRSVRLFVRVGEELPGAETIVEPRLRAAFVEFEGLRAHLEDWLEEDARDPALHEAAFRLRDALEVGERKKVRRGRFPRH